MKKIDLEGMVDVVGGNMTLSQLTNEIKNYVYWKSPSKMVVTIEKDRKFKRYYSRIYIPEKDFKKKTRLFTSYYLDNLPKWNLKGN